MEYEIGKSGLSEAYRRAYMRFGATNYAMSETVKHAIQVRQAEIVLRNGQRIIQACESVRKEIEAERVTP